MKYIIWDFDGTLFDTYGAIVKAFEQCLMRDFATSVSMATIYRLVKVDTKHCANILADEYGLDAQDLLLAARGAYNKVSSEGQRPFEGAREICEEVLSKGGKNLLVTHRDKASLASMLNQHDFTVLFDEVICSDDGFPQKPDPASFNYLLDKLRLSRDLTLGIGDRDLDVQAANMAGVTSVFFCPQGRCHSDADANISELRQLLDVWV